MIATQNDLQAYAEQYRRFEENNKLTTLGLQILWEIQHKERSEESLNDFERRAVLKAIDVSIFLLNVALLVSPK